MSDPRRLSEGGGMGHRLLAAADGDRPSDESRKKAAIALGIAAPILPPASVGATAPATTAPASVVKIIGAKIGVSTIAPIAIAAVIAGGGVWAAGRPGPEPAFVAPTVHVAKSPASTQAPAPLPELPPETPIVVVVEEGPAPVAEAPKPKRRGPVAVVVPLAQEVKLLDRARAALKANDSAGTLAALQLYRSECPSGRMLPEAELIEIDRLILAGDRPGAARAAQAYRARWGERLPPRHRALLGSEP